MILKNIYMYIGDMTNAQIAAKAYCDVQTVRNAKDGKSISHNTAKRIALALGVNLGDLR